MRPAAATLSERISSLGFERVCHFVPFQSVELVIDYSVLYFHASGSKGRFAY